jgi:hypothetical protein
VDDCIEYVRDDDCRVVVVVVVSIVSIVSIVVVVSIVEARAILVMDF